MSQADQTFAALADPTRRTVFELLVRQSPATATALSGELAISRQAVAKHLAMLAQSGLATAERVGRETRYRADITGLDQLDAWAAEHRSLWTRRLDRLAGVAESGRVVAE